jgi:hypothetical protein
MGLKQTAAHLVNTIEFRRMLWYYRVHPQLYPMVLRHPKSKRQIVVRGRAKITR